MALPGTMGQSAGGNVRQFLAIAKKAEKKGRAQECAQACKSILAVQPGHQKALAMLGLASLQLGDFKTGIGALQQAVAGDPSDVQAFVNLGKAFAHVGYPDEAEKAFHGALASKPEDVDARLNYAILLEMQERFVDAKKHYQFVSEKRPRTVDAWIGLGNCQRAAGEFEEAVHSFKQAIKLQPKLAGAYNNLASLLLEIDDVDAAIEAFQQAVKLDATRADSWFNLGLALQKTDKLNDAIEALEQARKLAPEDDNMIINLGMAYQKADNIEAAVRCYEAVNKLVPNDFGGHTKLVSAYIQSDELEKAMAVCDSYLASHPGDTAMISCKAIVLNEMGRDEEHKAIVDFDRFVRPILITTPDGYNDMAAFNKALSAHCANHPTLEYSTNATRNGMHSKDMLESEKGPLVELEKQILAAVSEYRQTVETEPSHPFTSITPSSDDDYKLVIWSVIMYEQGHQLQHIHPSAWLSGVYYPKVPAAVGSEDDKNHGWIEFGKPSEEYPCKRETPCVSHLPVEGKMFLFPSFMYHRTIPLESDETRISIAFDIVLNS